MKLNQIKALLEAPQLVVIDGKLESGFGIIFNNAEGSNIDMQDLDTIQIYVEKPAFIKALGEMYDYSYHDDKPLDMSELHDDPEVKKQLQKKMGKRKPKKILTGEDCTTMEELMALPNWDQFTEYIFVWDNF